MQSFVQFALSFPGHQGINVLRPPVGGRDYTVVDQFSDESARSKFKASVEYQDWMRRLGELTDGDPRIEELSGLEGWFTLPEHAGLAKPPKYKMAVATFLGVFPVAMSLNLVLGPVIRSWHFVLGDAVFNLCVVSILTWWLRWDGVPSLADGLRMLKEQVQRTLPGQWVRVVGGWS